MAGVTPHRLGAAAALVGVILLTTLIVQSNVRRGCILGEFSPHTCGILTATRAPEILRERIARDVGDAAAYVQLARSLPEDQRHDALAAASLMAPADPNTLLMLAQEAAARQDWAGAARALVQIAQFRDDATAPQALARLIAGGQGNVLAPLVGPDSRWLRATLLYVRETPGGITQSIPLIVQGLCMNALSKEQVAGFVVDLKAASKWADAYGLWVMLHPSGIPLLYNGNFELPLDAGAFNWETLPARQQPGTVIERLSSGLHQRILEMSFNTRSIGSPILRQFVFLAPGRHVLQGEFRASRLRVDSGIAWALGCRAGSGTRQEAPLLEDTGGEWRTFQFQFDVPKDCGQVASLEIGVAGASHASGSGTGRIALRELTLIRTESTKPPNISQQGR